MSLEVVIRPVQSVPVSPPMPPQPAAQPDNSTPVTIGGTGKMSCIQLNSSRSGDIKEYEESYENQRVVDLARVKNANDHSQYVDMEVTKQLSYWDSVNQQQKTLNLAPVQASDNVEILQTNIVKNTTWSG